MNCMMCGFVNPISHVVVRAGEEGKVVGRICGSHTLAEVVLHKKYKPAWTEQDDQFEDVFDVEVTYIGNDLNVNSRS